MKQSAMMEELWSSVYIISFSIKIPTSIQPRPHELARHDSRHQPHKTKTTHNINSVLLPTSQPSRMYDDEDDMLIQSFVTPICTSKPPPQSVSLFVFSFSCVCLSLVCPCPEGQQRLVLLNEERHGCLICRVRMKKLS